MIKKTLIFGVISLFFLSYCKGQQEINYTMFMFNKLAINPAYAGSVDALRVSGHYRNQWTAFAGAPKNFTLSAHSTIFSKRMGGGITLTSDQTGIVKEHIADVAYAYKIPMQNKSTLSIGLSGMVQYKRFNWHETNPLHEEDPELPDVSSSRLNPNFGMGTYFKTTKFYAGVSIPRLFATSFYNYSNYEEFGTSAARTIYLMGGFIKEINKNLKLQPGILMTLNGRTPFEMDLNASLVFLDKVWVGFSYRLEDSINGIFQFQFTNQWKGAVALDFTLSELNNYAPVSFEIMAQYTMVNAKGQVENIRFF